MTYSADKKELSLKKMIKIAVLVCASLAMSANAKKPSETSGKDLTKQLKVIFKNSLKDPDSAKFKDEFLSFHESENAIALCGFFNSKNSYGGYVGFQPFIVTAESMVISDTVEVPTATRYLWPIWCLKPIK
jgi:hypothetical protein